MSRLCIAIVGGVTGAVALVAVILGVVWFFILHRRNQSNQNSETGSSEPSAQGELRRGGSTAAPSSSGSQGPRRFTIGELEQATRNFHESNIIGEGSFGLVYEGLLHDGTVVAIKRRNGELIPELIEEVAYLSEIRHRNLVTLIGSCNENGSQMLVFEYLTNGSLCSHLYDTRQDSKTKLEFKQRISIALGAAKGLCHLHCLRRPLVHGNFKTANVLVDENFIVKVADAGVSKILERVRDPGQLSTTSVNIFQDPEIEALGTLSRPNDVYSFGIFLLELVTGKDASQIILLQSGETIPRWVEAHSSRNDFVDSCLLGTFTADGMQDAIRLMLQCMAFPIKRRPKMEMVVAELDRILENEMAVTTGVNESTTTIVTLGSELFTS
ncbi:hypothetical protein Ancab_030550 [Ancistrocladus abbreviatus]